MKRIAPIILSSLILATACTQNPKPNALANGDASLKPQVRQPAERDLLVVFTPQPSYAEIVVQSQGRSRHGMTAYRKELLCSPSWSPAIAAWQPVKLPAFAIAITSSDPITDDELALAAATELDRDPLETARRVLERLTANSPSARWSTAVRQITY